MVRIRYIVNDEGTELLSKPVNSINGVFRSQILRTNGGWTSKILQLMNNDTEATSIQIWAEVEGTGSSTKNLSVAKSKAKQNLKTLGVRFLEEVRRKGTENGI